MAEEESFSLPTVISLPPGSNAPFYSYTSIFAALEAITDDDLSLPPPPTTPETTVRLIEPPSFKENDRVVVPEDECIPFEQPGQSSLSLSEVGRGWDDTRREKRLLHNAVKKSEETGDVKPLRKLEKHLAEKHFLRARALVVADPNSRVKPIVQSQLEVENGDVPASKVSVYERPGLSLKRKAPADEAEKENLG